MTFICEPEKSIDWSFKFLHSNHFHSLKNILGFYYMLNNTKAHTGLNSYGSLFTIYIMTSVQFLVCVGGWGGGGRSRIISPIRKICQLYQHKCLFLYYFAYIITMYGRMEIYLFLPVTLQLPPMLSLSWTREKEFWILCGKKNICWGEGFKANAFSDNIHQYSQRSTFFCDFLSHSFFSFQKYFEYFSIKNTIVL